MTIRWGIIGCGDVTEVKSGPGFQQATGSSLVAVMRRNGEKAADYAQRHHVPHHFNDADDLINHPEVDAVYIATPPGRHLEYALKVCKAGKPAYVEKPMARTETECAQMVDTFEKAGVPLFVAYYRRSLDRFIKARDLTQSGRIGNVTGVTYRFSTQPLRRVDTNTELTGATPIEPHVDLPWRVIAEDAGGGLFLDIGCHTLDIIDFITGGPLQFVGGAAANRAGLYDVEDTVTLSFLTHEGAVGAAHWNFAAGFLDDDIEITGSLGRISLSTFGKEPVHLFTATGLETFDLPNPVNIQAPMIQSIVNTLLGVEGAACPSTGATALRTSRLIDKSLNSYYGGRQDAFWARPDTWPGRIARPTRRTLCFT